MRALVMPAHVSAGARITVYEARRTFGNNHKYVCFGNFNDCV